ncbi:hypothetical protein [Marinobacterium sediminicola]|uniref:Transmembrane anchor protein n=1 Tax=Marinobacterium sediminicola TaxID=518898 RepID=A0ABY1S259_9GAMM|nr:hypothetical protein [Marinobacterium sediminicola]ULG68511.1 hypothetical protein LN244_12510 [Marinobacterium sediminicola]SMR76671.1 hypothetical protein SAMN04487964_11245 [Marinobacterium sediminicola]
MHTPPDVMHMSNKGLLKTTLLTLTIALVLLITLVLPAEFGIDPLGSGRLLGLDRLQAQASEPAPANRLWTGEGPFKSDTLTLTLLPGQGAELKAVMEAHAPISFHWTSEGGPVHVDMHGEAENAAPGEYTSYWLDDALTSASGSLRAPFKGTHGWYWENRGSQAVTIRLNTAGFYRTLYMP